MDGFFVFVFIYELLWVGKVDFDFFICYFNVVWFVIDDLGWEEDGLFYLGDMGWLVIWDWEENFVCNVYDVNG